jgi:hypothetical protein
MAGGANDISLLEAQANFAVMGATSAARVPHVRPAGPSDVRDPLWRPIDPNLDAIEDPISGKDYGADYPADHAELYYWRPTYWRRRPDGRSHL